MPTRKDQMRLGAFFHPTGHHVAAWLDPGSQIDAGTNFAHYAQMTQAAEAAKFDLVFLADAIATRDGNLQALRRWPQYMAYFDPITLLAGLAAVTKHIGLVATATTSFNEPYHVARRFASLDHISGGRAGWNVVTSSNPSEAFNFGRDAHFGHTERYERADEFVKVAKGLWDSWDDDAFLRDRASSLYFDPERIHFLNHKGKHFAVRGPLNVARPPQGYPVLFQASASDTGKELAAQIAEVVFTPLHDLEQAKKFYRQLKDHAGQYGRSDEDVVIMPGLNVVVAESEKDADEKIKYLQSLIHPDVGKELLSTALGGLDLSPYDVDEPLPEHIVEAERRKNNSRVAYMFDGRPTLRQMYETFGTGRGQRTIKGTPSSIVDQMQKWFESFAVDGYLIQPPILPADLEEFNARIIPELQNRGLFRTEYAGRTLRENLGLKRPPSMYAAEPATSRRAGVRV
ncbi:LLM class flavin-dependent oxidoreductase [Bradyrhizobium sp. NP1]|uniref:LLM class flavin-dependent oxidoreductase n=1 Tax=Bradyrhizobium sp. NP1 TaxID=3049772 RepID=UPI0025A67622|nr:LLM class flavin-dependent oxidoreductase [Bradyrhizobium sp. NP1]WJR77858.1 LLM class flavin-dependent oxidoreductase [Bradyrhizobium sp. NP1]